MNDVLSILSEASGSIRLEVSGKALLTFSCNLINRAKEKLAIRVAEARKVRFLTKKQVKELCNVLARQCRVNSAAAVRIAICPFTRDDAAA